PARRGLAFRRAQLHLRDQAAEVLISLTIFDEQRQTRAAHERDLGAHQRLDPGVDRGPVQPWRTVHAIAIDERDRAHVSLHRLGRPPGARASPRRRFTAPRTAAAAPAHSRERIRVALDRAGGGGAGAARGGGRGGGGLRPSVPGGGGGGG